MITTILQTGENTTHEVLAEVDPRGFNGLSPVRYFDGGRAIRKAEELQSQGVTCWVYYRGTFRYIVIENA